MRVAVGSTNPVKVAAAERVLVAAERVDPLPVKSGVPEQPRGLEETARGARTRARRALPVGGEGRQTGGDEVGEDRRTDVAYDLGIGIEGGVAELPGAEGLFLVMWAAVTDGDRMELGAGPSLRLPSGVADRIRAGEELGPVMDDRLNAEGVAREQGASGVLTGGAIDREQALASAVAGAAGPFRTDHYRE